MNKMTYIFLGLSLVFLFSCEVKKDDIGYRIEQTELFDGFYQIKLLNKNDVEITTIIFNNDGTIRSYTITDSKNIISLVNLGGDGIISYSISDGNNYKNTTNFAVDGDLFLMRDEQITENIIYEEMIYRNGLVLKE